MKSPINSTFYIALLILLSASQFSQDFLAQIQNQYGLAARKRFEDLEHLIQQKTSEPLDLIKKINLYYNQFKFKSDLEHWQRKDYWATPFELISTGAGDCEDFSIAKYMTLRKCGIPDGKLRIAYVKALELNQAHMVLLYYSTPQSDPLVLDNINPKLLPATKRKDLSPIYFFNGEKLWLSKSRHQEQLVGKSSELFLWNQLLQRMNSKFFKLSNQEKL